MTFHPPGGRGSSEWFLNENWLDLNMIQTGHGYNHANYEMIATDYARKPYKPCIDGEPGYEDHPAEFNPKNGYLNEYDTRKSAYWSLFAGACGHTYGCHDIWQFFAPGRPPITSARTPWRRRRISPVPLRCNTHVRLWNPVPSWLASPINRCWHPTPAGAQPSPGDPGRGRKLCLRLFPLR